MWFLTLRKEHELRVSGDQVLRGVFGSEREELTGHWRKLLDKERRDMYSSPNIIWVIKSNRMRWAGLVARMEQVRSTCRVLMGKPERKKALGKH